MLHVGCVLKQRCLVGSNSSPRRDSWRAESPCSSASSSDTARVELRRAGSMALPTLMERGSMGSTLSLAVVNRDNADTVRQLQEEWKEETVRKYFFSI